MATLPHMIHEGGYEDISGRALAEEERAIAAGGEVWDEYNTDRENQVHFLDAFQRNFSIKMSIRVACVEYRTYQGWRRNSIYFAQRFNLIIEEWHSEMYTSAAYRARGYLVEDVNTESGYAETAEGAPIYHGADSGLTKMFLKSMYPDKFGDKLDMDVSGKVDTRLTHALDPGQYGDLRRAMMENDDC